MFMKNYSPGGQDMFGEGILQLERDSCWYQHAGLTSHQLILGSILFQ